MREKNNKLEKYKTRTLSMPGRVLLMFLKTCLICLLCGKFIRYRGRSGLDHLIALEE